MVWSGTEVVHYNQRLLGFLKIKKKELQNVSAQPDELQTSARRCHHNLIKHSKSLSIYTKGEQRLADIETNVQQKPLIWRELYFRNQHLTLQTACTAWKTV